MAWANGPLTVFHGTDNLSANAIRLGGISQRRFRARTDFGLGFYVTTVRHQAEQWANQRCRRAGAANAEVLVYNVARADVETLNHLCFLQDDVDYYDFVAFCRSGAVNHGPSRAVPYEIVYGPVSLWPQRLAIADCDQILFSDPSKVGGFGSPSHSVMPPGGARFF